MATWHLAQEALNARSLGGGASAPNSKTASFLLRGVMHCEACGAVCAAVPSDRGKTRGYYTCRRRLDPTYNGVACKAAVYPHGADRRKRGIRGARAVDRSPRPARRCAAHG